MLSIIGNFVLSGLKLIGNFVLSALKKIGNLCWNVLANTFRVIGISAYAYNSVKYTLKICANYLFNANFDVAYELHRMAKIEAQKTFGSVCSRIGVLGWLAKGVIGSITLLMAGIGLSATNWHRMHIWWLNRTNEKINENASTDNPQNVWVDTSQHEGFFKAAHGDYITRYLSRINVIRGIAIALKDYVLPAVFIVGTSVPIFMVRNFIYKPLKAVLKLLLLPFTCCCCPKPTTEMRQLVKDLNTFHNRLDSDGSLPGVIDPKTREIEGKDQPGSQYVTEVSTCYAKLNGNTSWSESICHWISKEIRIATSFALPNVEERVIAAFVDAVEEYSTNEGASLKGFLEDRYVNIVETAKNDFNRSEDKETVDRVAWAIRYALIEKDGIKESAPDEWKYTAYIPQIHVKPSAPYIDPEDLAYNVDAEPFRLQFGDPSAPLPSEVEVQLEGEPQPVPSAPPAPSFFQRFSIFNQPKSNEGELNPIIPHHLLVKFKV